MKPTNNEEMLADIILECDKKGNQWFLEDEWGHDSKSGRAYGVK